MKPYLYTSRRAGKFVGFSLAIPKIIEYNI